VTQPFGIEAKTDEIIAISRHYGELYFDGRAVIEFASGKGSVSGWYKVPETSVPQRVWTRAVLITIESFGNGLWTTPSGLW